MSVPARADRAALLERAAFQGIRYDERASADYQQALVEDACAELGCDATRAARHWVRNRNADLWKIDAPDGCHVLKILTSKPVETLECEYEHLVALDGIARESGLFRVPRPRTLFAGRSAYVMEFVTFRSLPDLLLDPGAVAAGDAAVGACGRALAAIHAAWSEGDRPFDAAAARADFDHLPWTPGRRESAALERLFTRLDGQDLPNARLYLDFDPVNVGVVDDGTLVVLDPPERHAVDARGWDLGVFLFGLRRAAWKRPLAMRRWARRLPDVRRAFVEGYAARYPGAHAGATDVTTLAEIARLGQLWRWWSTPLAFRGRSLGFARAVYAWPLLRAARRRLVAAAEGRG